MTLQDILARVVGPEIIENNSNIVGFEENGTKVIAKLEDGRSYEGDLLIGVVLLVIITNTLVIYVVVKRFRYNNNTSFLVGISLAQIGEFAFVLVGLASNLKLIDGKLYLLLLGTITLSFDNNSTFVQVNSYVAQLGVQASWFSLEISQFEVVSLYSRTP